jgi:molybdopterin-guanine dinucleotide biosynthesis protein A
MRVKMNINKYNTSMLTLAIQAGGKSSRMGQDKALMPFRGKPLIQTVMARLAPLADEIIITTNTPEHYAFLGVPLFRDIIPERGALGGLYTALKSASHSMVAVVACDMPFASTQFFETATRLMSTGAADVVIPQTEYGFEPLHALYRREACLAPIEQALDANRWKVISWFDAVHVHALSRTETAALDPGGLAFWNLNTPEDFAKAEKLG